MNKSNRFWRRIIVLAICSMVLMMGSMVTSAQEEVATATAEDISNLTVAIDTTWVMLTAFLVFFMQAGFAMLEAGLIRQRGVVNALLENFIDAGITAICWWAVGFGIAFGTSQLGGLFGGSMFAIGMETMNEPFGALNITVMAFFFFQFAFAATASTIATGGMAERTDFVGDIIYSGLTAMFIYPVIVHWVWGGGWLATLGFMDFAGSTVVHTVGGVLALVGAIMLGPRPGREFGNPPRPHNLALAVLGTMILWFGWYGFNPGSTLGAVGMGALIGLVAVNTTLAAAAGALATMFFMFIRTGKWDLAYTLNGSLAGLVGITAGCAIVTPFASIVIGLTAGVVVVLAMDAVERAKVDDAVGAFAVHGACGMLGSLAVGFLADATLTFGTHAGKAGLLMGGSADILVTQFIGVAATVAYVTVAGTVMFGALKLVNRLRVSTKADAIGIDAYEHGATLWPDVLPVPEELPAESPKVAPAAGD